MNHMENETIDMPSIQSNKIKLIKNTKGYQWEISLLSLDVDELEGINNKMLKKFGEVAI
jgi:hypothetical protein